MLKTIEAVFDGKVFVLKARLNYSPILVSKSP